MRNKNQCTLNDPTNQKTTGEVIPSHAEVNRVFVHLLLENFTQVIDNFTFFERIHINLI